MTWGPFVTSQPARSARRSSATVPGIRQALEATITARVDVAPALAIFRVRPDAESWPFEPGQYVTLGLRSDGSLVERPYSLASSARRLDEGYELYVRLVPGGALTPLLFESRPGCRVSLRRPKGRFTLTEDGDAVCHLFIASGCGVAPFASMLRTLEDDHTPRRVVLLHGVSYVRELAYRRFFEQLARDPRWQLTYVPTVSRPDEAANAGWTGRRGRVESVVDEVCDALRIAAADEVAYVCGNPEMTRSVHALLRRRGLGPDRIRTELYWPLRAGA